MCEAASRKARPPSDFSVFSVTSVVYWFIVRAFIRVPPCSSVVKNLGVDMKNRFSLFAVSVLSCALVGPLLAQAAKPAPAPGSWEAWSAVEPIRQKFGALRKTDAAAAAALLEDELNKVSDPHVAADFFTLLGEVYTDDLKAPDKTVALIDRALPIFQKPAYKVPPYHYMTMVAAKANALAALKKGAEAEALLKENWPLVVQSNLSDNLYAQRTSRDSVRAQIAALEAQDKGAQVNAFLADFLLGSPNYLNMQSNSTGYWIFNELQTRLKKQEKWDEALGWAKLSYQLCPFEKAEIERATQTLSKIWAAQDDFAAAGMFSKAQTDTTTKNPLVAVKTPVFSEETRASLKKQIADLEGRQQLEFKPDRARIIVKFYLTLGTPDDMKDAMKAAVKLLKDRPDLQDGSLSVCRVFKAADCNLIRANAFLSYMAGEGANPVSEFLKK